MKKLIYLCLFFLVAFSVTTCDSDSKITDPTDSTYDELVVQKDSQPSRLAKCDDCSEETAWAAGGGLYNPGGAGNWATYIRYTGVRQIFQIYAGQYLHAGAVVLSPVPGGVKFDLILFDGDNPWCFQDVEEPVKIEGYSAVPRGNPKVGLFSFKPVPVFMGGDIEGRVFDLGVWESHAYYGVHLDLGCCN